MTAMRSPTPQDKLYAWYYAALAHGAGSPQAPIHADQPQCGYFRLKVKDGLVIPAYIAMEAPLDEFGELTGDERMVCYVLGNGALLKRDPADAWVKLAGHPVPFEYFEQAWNTGKWPDEAPGANFQFADTMEGLKDQLEAMMRIATELGPIDTQLKYDQAANLKDRAMECKKALDDMRKAEKQPHDDAAKAVQLRFKPLIDEAAGLVEWLRAHMAPFARAEEAKVKEAAAAAGVDPKAVNFKARGGGMGGRRTSTRKEVVANIVDFDAALAFVKDQPEIREAVEVCVRRCAKAGVKVPGVEIREETKVI
jgi:hypothetical protein